ncbi:MAG: hypothetical protein CMB80_08855 [Flammeovirgaceae bacterium]|nr:hypothetical protein [Flammeovirgaceae bacterium]
MPKDIQKQIKKEKDRNYLAKDFNSFRADLLDYARTFFPDQINDFSDASVGGLLLDMAAFVGDTLSFYLDHQFNELNPLTAVETNNLIRHLQSAGVKVVGASPAVCEVLFSIRVPSEVTTLYEWRPRRSALPIITAGTILQANNGIIFNLVEDLDFGITDSMNDLNAHSKITQTDSNGNPSEYELQLRGLCISGQEKIVTFNIANAHVPFREIIIPDPDVSDIITIKDSDSNNYYEVESLTQDVVFGGSPTIDSNGETVEQDMEIIPAPRRFIKRMSPQTRLTTLTFGGGNADTLDDDIIPDPSMLALPLYGRKTFSRFVIDPNSLLQTQTLGIAPRNTSLSIKYRFGGGLSHNVGQNSIRTITNLKMMFMNTPQPAHATSVRASASVNNDKLAGGGLSAPTLEDLRAIIPKIRQSQGRSVSRADTIARIYTLPSRFGRVYRAAISSSSINPLAANLYVIGLDNNGSLAISPDALKKNLSRYLNQYRLISDALDILDARVLNFGVIFTVVSHPNSNKELVVQQVIKRLRGILTIKNFQINQPIVMADIINLIINTEGVISMPQMPRIIAKYGVEENRDYGVNTFTPENLEVRGMIIAPPGSIFQLKYPDFDITGTSS